jgi:hypothetical protein
MQTLRKLSLIILSFAAGFTHCAPLLTQAPQPTPADLKVSMQTELSTFQAATQPSILNNLGDPSIEPRGPKLHSFSNS